MAAGQFSALEVDLSQKKGYRSVANCHYNENFQGHGTNLPSIFNSDQTAIDTPQQLKAYKNA